MTHKKEVEVSLQKKIQAKIIHAKSRSHLTDRDVYEICKEFFSELLKLDYEFTHEELIEELQKTYLEKKDLEQATAFIRKIGRVEYTSTPYEQEELHTMLEELRTIISRLSHEEYHKTWFERFKERLFPKQKSPEEEEKELIAKQLQELQKLLEQIEKEKNVDKKHKLYQEALLLYEILEEEEKVSFYNDLLGVYYHIKEKKKEHKEEQKEAVEEVELSDEDLNLNEEELTVVDAKHKQAETKEEVDETFGEFNEEIAYENQTPEVGEAETKVTEDEEPSVEMEETDEPTDTVETQVSEPEEKVSEKPAKKTSKKKKK